MPSSQSDPKVEAIRSALEGPVIDVFRREIDELRHLPRAAAYGLVMNDPKMLDRCLRLFRSRPDLFREVVVDGGRQPVSEDHALLACGRTLAEAVALVVRASARRYFRARLDIRARPASSARPALMNRLGVALGLSAPPRPAPRPRSRSDALYRAIRDYLHFDWQVLLIPHYAPMSPALVTNLGPRLLEIREAAELQALSAPGVTPQDGRPPLLLDVANRLLMPGRDAIDAEILWRVVQQMDLARLFSAEEPSRVRRAVAQVSAIHGDAIRALMPALGGDTRRFAAFLMIAFSTLGEQRFKQDFCQEGQTHAVRALAERLAAAEPPPHSLEAMRAAYQPLLSTAYAGGVEVEGRVLKTRPDLVKALGALGASRPNPVSVSG